PFCTTVTIFLIRCSYHHDYFSTSTVTPPVSGNGIYLFNRKCYYIDAEYHSKACLKIYKFVQDLEYNKLLKINASETPAGLIRVEERSRIDLEIQRLQSE